MGALTVGIVTLPFTFEGSRRRRAAEEGLASLCSEVDAIITVPNDRLLSLIGRDRSLSESFKVADDVLRQGVQGIAEVINVPGLVNVDFADVRSVLRGAGTALMSIGRGQGRNRALRAAEEAIAGGFLSVSIRGAQRVLFNISGGEDMTLFEVNEVAEQIGSAIHDAADITFGAVIDPSLDDTIRVTLIAAGMPEAHTSHIPVIHMEQPETPPTSYVAPAARPHNAAVASAPIQAPGAGLLRPRNSGNPPRPGPGPERVADLPTQATYLERAGRTPGRPQRSLDDLRGLRSMGRRRAAGQADEAAEVEMPPFLRKFE
jgi:cell division protein FtsZ